MLARHYEDLTVTDRENVAKKRLIDYGKKHNISSVSNNDIENDEKNRLIDNRVESKDPELEDKKSKFLSMFDQYYFLLQNTIDLFVRNNAGEMKTPQNNTDKFYSKFGTLMIQSLRIEDILKSILKTIPINDDFNKKFKKRSKELESMMEKYLNEFQINIQNGTTNFEETGGPAGNQHNRKDDFDEKIVAIYDGMKRIHSRIGDLIRFLDSTPRSGEGRRYNVDTTEYIIPSKYM